jgi:hypothetical protein
MNYTQRQNTEYARERLENQLEEGQRFLEVTSLPNLEDLQAYQERICEWRNATYALFQELYDRQSIHSAYCPSVEKIDLKLEMRDEAIDKLKAEVSKILDILQDLLSKCDWAKTGNPPLSLSKKPVSSMAAPRPMVSPCSHVSR